MQHSSLIFLREKERERRTDGQAVCLPCFADLYDITDQDFVMHLKFVHPRFVFRGLNASLDVGQANLLVAFYAQYLSSVVYRDFDADLPARVYRGLVGMAASVHTVD